MLIYILHFMYVCMNAAAVALIQNLLCVRLMQKVRAASLKFNREIKLRTRCLSHHAMCSFTWCDIKIDSRGVQ